MACCFGLLALDVQAAPDVTPPPLAGSVIVSETPYPWDKVHSIARIGESEVFVMHWYPRNGVPIFGANGVVVGAVDTAPSEKKLAEETASGVTVPDTFVVREKIRQQVARLAPNLLTTSSPPTMELAGAVLIRTGPNSQVRSSLIITATDTTARRGWSKGYFYHFAHLADGYALRADGGRALLAVLNSELDDAVATTMTVLLDDFAGWLGDGSPIRVSSRFLTPQFDVTFPFEGVEVGKRGDLTILRLDSKPPLMQRFPAVDGVHLFQPRQFERVPLRD